MKYLPLVLLGLACAASAAKSLTPNEIMAQIQERGGRKVLSELWEHQTKFNEVLSGIESADIAWLKVAVLLRPFSDAAVSEELDMSVALALPKAPERILSLVGHGFDLEFARTSPFDGPEPGVAEAYERKALVALAAVREPRLRSLATECAKRVKLAQHGA